jgi:hypothetical protein
MTINLTALPATIDIFHLGLATLALLLFILLLVKKGQSKETPAVNEPRQSEASAAITQESMKERVRAAKAEAPSAQPARLKETGPEAALQLLALLQQDARFIDFIQEDLTGFSDADIGAAARVVHEGSKKTLHTYFELAPIRQEEEEARISLALGFNAAEVRLTGNVVGEAPFNGVLVHKGWKVTRVSLPRLSDGHDSTIVAPAEVEL